MTPTPRSDHPALADRRPYRHPAFTELGSIGSLTAGPDAQKTLDGLVGGSGGFLQDDVTS